MTKLLCSVLVNLLVLVSLSSQNSDGSEHPNLFISKGRTKRDMPNFSFIPPKLETDPDFWNGKAQNTLKQRLSINRLNKNVAKNVIFFLGDGMGLATLMATRMYKGGEEKELSFERFPYTGLSKTYCTNVQVADSACSATSFLCGVKANYGTIGVSAAVLQGDCMGQNNTSNHVDSIIKFAQDNGMRTGIITNTRITHATPAGTYAHIANRDWENDVMVKKGGGSTETCPDIAYQLIHGLVGKRLNIVLGGGRQEFMMETEKDIDGNYGKRTDKNLLKHWKHIHRKENHRYVETLDDLKSVDNNVERLLGIFDSSHMPFYLDDGAKQKPTLSEMVDKALDIFESANDNKGYFLFVEGGKIDLGHHYGLAKKALQETVELEKAVELARLRTSEENTLVVVSSDHSHAFTVSGYSSRGNDILGLSDGQRSQDGLPYTTLGYENGPSYYQNVDKNGRRENLETKDTKDKDYGFPSKYPLEYETHSGEDVGVFASGPFAHLFSGVYEQNYIPHAIKYAACLGDGLTSCTDS